MTPSLSPAAAGVVVADRCSKWYGQVLGVSDVSWTLRGGIVGLLGPNGAGKSTLIKMMAGLLQPSRGTLAVYGQSPFHDTAVRRRIGYAPEHEQTWDELTARELVTAMARLAGVPAGKADATARLSIPEDHSIDGAPAGEFWPQVAGCVHRCQGVRGPHAGRVGVFSGSSEPACP